MNEETLMNTTVEEEYDASAIQVLEGLEAVRKRPGMYIGSTGERGLHHLVYEIVDNSIDEALAGYCTDIDVEILDGDIIRVKDNGRGIPVDIQEKMGLPAVTVVFTVLHAGGKFGGSGYKVSGGLHGVGSSVVNALSDWLEVEVRKDGKIHRQRFEKGNAVGNLAVVGETNETGTTVTFKPSAEIFTDTTRYDYNILLTRLREQAFLNAGIRINLADKRKDADFDDDGNESAQEEVQEGCEEGPDQSPGQNAAKLLTNGIVGIKQCKEVFNTNPVKENQIIGFLGVVGECHAHHVEQRQNGKDRDTSGGQDHQQLVNVLIEQSLNILEEVQGLMAGLLHSQGLITAAHGQLPHKDQQQDDAQGSNAIQQDQLRLIAHDVLICAQIVIPDFLHRTIAQRRQHGDPVDTAAAGAQKCEYADFHSQEQQALNDLSGCHVAKTHDDAGKPHQRAAVFQSSKQRRIVQVSPLSRCLG